MTEAEFGTIQQEGVSRRDVMKRGALVGGAMVWATPIVQTMGSPAFASEGTPDSEGSVSFVAISYKFTDGEIYTFKFNSIDDPESCEDHVDELDCSREEVDCGSLDLSNPCDEPAAASHLDSQTTSGLSSPKPSVTACSTCKVTIQMPSGSSNIKSVTKCGSECVTGDHGTTLNLEFTCEGDDC